MLLLRRPLLLLLLGLLCICHPHCSQQCVAVGWRMWVKVRCARLVVLPPPQSYRPRSREVGGCLCCCVIGTAYRSQGQQKAARGRSSSQHAKLPGVMGEHTPAVAYETCKCTEQFPCACNLLSAKLSLSHFFLVGGGKAQSSNAECREATPCFFSPFPDVRSAAHTRCAPLQTTERKSCTTENAGPAAACWPAAGRSAWCVWWPQARVHCGIPAARSAPGCSRQRPQQAASQRGVPGLPQARL